MPETPDMARPRRAFVWDLPTRSFHWSIAALFAVAWFTGGEKGAWFTVHQIAGYGILVAILFRLVWGFVGSEHSRFRNFVRPWPAVRDYGRRLLALRLPPSLGHNPVGGWMIVLMLVALGVQVGTGLFAAARDIGGPLAASIGPGLAHVVAEFHETFATFVLVLVGVHIAGVLVHRVVAGENLVLPMLTGYKRLPASGGASGTVAPYWRAAMALGFATAVAWWIVAA